MLPGRISRGNQRGYALASTLVVLLLLLTIGMASTVYSVLDWKATTHYRAGNQALFAAEAGVLRGLGAINNTGVVDFENDVANRWVAVFGTPSKPVGNDDAVSYVVGAHADGASSANAGALAATGVAPATARRGIRVTLRKAGFLPGAVFLPPDNAGPVFEGDAFEFDGSDHNPSGAPTCPEPEGGGGDGGGGGRVTIYHIPPGNHGNPQTITVGASAVPAHLALHGDTLGPCSATGGEGDDGDKVTICHIPPGNPGNPQTITVGASAVPAHVALHGDTLGPCSESDDGPGDEECVPGPGIATRTEEVRDSILEALSDQQQDNVKGEGSTPSVEATRGPGVEDIDRFLAHVLSNPNVNTSFENDLAGNIEFGSTGTPQVTHLAYPGEVTLSGGAEGAGILVVEGSLTIDGGLDFVGWIVVKNDLTVAGSASVLGSVWTSGLVIDGGSAVVEYCSACLAMADSLPGTAGGNVPQTMTIASWQEVY